MVVAILQPGGVDSVMGEPRNNRGQRVISLPKSAQADPIASAIRDHAKAMNNVSVAMDGISAAIRPDTVQRQHTDAFFKTANDALLCLGTFLRTKGPWILASIPLVLVSVGAISPNAAEALSDFLKAVGAQ